MEIYWHLTNQAILWLCIEKNNMGWFLTETETLSQTDRRRGEAKFNFMQVFLKNKISWNKSAPRTQPRDRGVQDSYIITTSFMAIHEIVLCELAGSQNWSNRLFYQHDFVRDCSDHLGKRQRDIRETTEWIWRDWGSIDNLTTIGICTGLVGSHNSTQICSAFKYVGTKMWTTAHKYYLGANVCTQKWAKYFLHIFVCKHITHRAMNWTDQIDLVSSSAFRVFYKKISYPQVQFSLPTLQYVHFLLGDRA